MAAVGGVNVTRSLRTAAKICQLQALSPVGRCRTFDASADGYGRGEAVAILILATDVNISLSLKNHEPRSSFPQHSGHPLALICGSAINQDGRSSSLTAPNGPAQKVYLMFSVLDMLVDSQYWQGALLTSIDVKLTFKLYTGSYTFRAVCCSSTVGKLCKGRASWNWNSPR